MVRLKPEKDDTDMMIALKRGLETGYRIFHIYGGCGGRFDHTLANIQCLAYLAQNHARGYLIGKKHTVTLIENERIEFPKERTGYVSVFSYGETARGVTIKGLKYTLTDAYLTDRVPLGVSNEFVGTPSLIRVREGRLLVVYETQ